MGRRHSGGGKTTVRGLLSNWRRAKHIIAGALIHATAGAAEDTTVARAARVVGIPMSVVVTIGPVAVLLVEADHGVVHKRLVQRDAAAPPLTTISIFAEREGRRERILRDAPG